MISVEAIEAVATRLYPGWQNSPADWQDYFRRKATEALEAAAPHIRAQAIEDAALDIRHWSHVFETLRARAADERTRK